MELSASFTRALLDGFHHAYADLLRVMTRKTGSRDEARELVHDIWLRLAEHAQRATEQAPAGDGAAFVPREVNAYLTTMVQNLALDQLRRGQFLANHVREQAASIALSPVHAPDAAESVMYRQAMSVLVEVVAALPARPREVFLAHRVQGENIPSLADRLGVSVNTVERDLMQAGDHIEDALHRWRGTAPTRGRKVDGPTRRRSLGALLGLAGLGASGSFAWWQWQAYRDAHVEWTLAAASQRNQIQDFTLDDGSIMELDALSRADVTYYAGRRVVQLIEGAAFFSVVRNVDRPFVVEAGQVRVTVLGTRFGVERMPSGNGDIVIVQVMSGRVRVEAPGVAPRELVGNEGLRITPDGRVADTRGEAATWREGVIEFDGRSLGEVLARLSRYTRHNLSASPAARSMEVTARVRTAQVGLWLEALPHALPVRLVPMGGGELRVALRGE